MVTVANIVMFDGAILVLGKPECRVDPKDPREWQIVLKLKHSQSRESNSPYFFMIAMVGVI